MVYSHIIILLKYVYLVSGKRESELIILSRRDFYYLWQDRMQ